MVEFFQEFYYAMLGTVVAHLKLTLESKAGGWARLFVRQTRIFVVKDDENQHTNGMSAIIRKSLCLQGIYIHISMCTGQFCSMLSS